MRRCALLIVIAAAAAAAPSLGADYTVRGLKISQPWARPAAQGLNGAAYFNVTNTNAVADVLLGVETPAAKRAVIHHAETVGGVSSMRPVSAGLTIPPGATARLAPGGDHVMLVGLNRALVQGGQAPATLVFQRAGRISVQLSVQTDAASPPASAGDHHHP